MYYIPSLLTNRYIKHGISTVEDGNMSFSYGERNEVIANRKNFLKQVKFPEERAVFIEVQHGTKIIKATESLGGTGLYSEVTAIKADAIVTQVQNLALVLMTADCVPAILYDRAHQVGGIAHISRHNTELKFAQTLVAFMKREFDSNLQELKIYLGPSIRKDSYILPDYPDGYDLIAQTTNQLLLKGVRQENIVIDDIDTVKSAEFFSHFRALRKNEKEGRFATIVSLS